MAGGGGWRVIPRPLLETVLGNYAAHHRVPHPLLLHGPRGSGKTTLVYRRLLDRWNSGPHLTAYVDFASHLSTTSPSPPPPPWASWPPSAAPLPALRALLERELERLVAHGLRLGAVTSSHVLAALNRHHALHHALRLLAGPTRAGTPASSSPSALWSRAVLGMAARMGPDELEAVAGPAEVARKHSREEEAGLREGVAALGVAREVIRMHSEWRREAIKEVNRTGRFSRPLAHAATDWPCLLIDVLSQAAELDFFQV